MAEAADREAYERHIATPADVDLEDVAALAGIPIQVVKTDRATNVRLHRETVERVAAALP